MGIKLVSFLAIFFGMLSCSSSKRTVSEIYSVSEEDYIKAYKTVVLYGCINEATNGDFLNFLQKNNDLIIFSEVDLLLHSEASAADSIGASFARTIKVFEYGDGKGKIPNYSRCVHYAFSKTIDSIAKKRYLEIIRE